MTRRIAMHLAALGLLAALLTACKKKGSGEAPAADGDVGGNQDAGY
ncbi:MAG: hypothetical protein R8L07_06585 [Alphaproteobacteria bacterium]|nr:hypothetical protein [Alphaproteobacteria bacterium]